MDLESAVRTAVAQLRGARSVTVLTGAGVSVASGVPPFRGPSGAWDQFSIEDLATPRGFRRDPVRVWEWYDSRRRDLLALAPNRGHEVLAAWSHRIPQFALVTQNVDGLHELAETRNVIRFHGSIWEVGCWQECPKSPHRWVDRTCPFPSLPPTCPHCGGMVRPGVVWFEEEIDRAVLLRSEEACSCDLFFSIGTSSIVHPAAGLIDLARSRGAFTLEINPDPTPARVDLSLKGPSEIVLDLIEQEWSRTA